MCGLFGSIGSSLTSKELEHVQTLGHLSVFRGPHSTGLLIAGRRNKGKINYASRKYVGPAHEMVWKKETERFFMENKPVLVMGHCRFATSGKINYINAHPIHEKHIIGMHNGTIRDFEPPKEKEEFSTDSRVLFEKISETGLESALDEAKHGAYALTWINAKEASFNIIRNDERPLWLMEDNKGETTYWASEEIMLEFLASQNKPRSFKEPFELPEYTLMQWKLGHSRAFNIEKLDKIKPRYANSDHSSAWDYCGKCWKSKQFCTCDEEQDLKYEEIFKDLPETLNKTTLLLPAPKDNQDQRPYKAYRGVITQVHKILHLLVCWSCNTQKAATDRVWWLSDSECICDDCLKHDPVAKMYLAPNKGNVWEGRLLIS